MLGSSLGRLTGCRSLPSALVNSSRNFATSKHEDLSLAGRYSGALLAASLKKKNLDKESKEFALFVESPAIQPAKKAEVFHALAEKYGYDMLTVNYLKTLLENKRLAELKRMIDNYEQFYRAEKNQLVCQVTTVSELSSNEKQKVESMLKKRESGRELIVGYKTNDAILGGIVVKMGEAVLDFSVQSKLERLCTKLAAPSSIIGHQSS